MPYPSAVPGFYDPELVADSRYEADYPELREVLDPRYADLPAEQVEEMVARALPGAAAEDFEGLLNDLQQFGRGAGRLGRTALPVVQQALPVVGTVAGTAFGGPVGAALGGFAGTAAAGALGAAAPRNRAPKQGGPAASPHAIGSPAAAQLLQLLTHPQVFQALTAMALGGAGRGHTRVGRTPVPVAAITNLLGVLAGRATAEFHAAHAGESTGTPSYLLDDRGELLVDPTEPEQRAAALLMRFAEADALEAHDGELPSELADGYDWLAEVYEEAYECCAEDYQPAYEEDYS